jgi:TonB-dependent Receptor Plug Domain/Carboxypeptidase regulatory-like domain
MHSWVVAFLAWALVFASIVPARAANLITGIVVDAASGIGIPGARVRIVENNAATLTDAGGHFHFDVGDLGSYHLSVDRGGYQPAISPRIESGHSPESVTLTLQRATDRLRTIAVTSTSRARSLLQASTYSATLNGEQLLRQGMVRAADSLRELPGVNNGITGDTGALGDDVNLSIRGIGTTETVATIDGHPIGYGIKGGYNYQLSPAFPYRNISVLYGSGGSDILGVNAIGGVVNFSTLDPTPEQHVAATQGFGTFERLATSVDATGTSGKAGYVFSYGASGLDGPFRNATFYQPGASSDVSAPPGSAPYERAVYTDDSSVTSRAGLVRFRFDPGAATSLRFTGVTQSYWENKTGNGDGDYLPYQTALARGDALLATNGSGGCPAGQLTTGNRYSVDGELPGCQTPPQYAALNSGWQGAGPAWHAFNLWYDDADANQRIGAGTLHADAFTTRYNDDQYRYNLPYRSVPGDTQKTTFNSVTSNGALISYELESENNDVEAGANYLNNAYIYRTIKATSTSESDPFAVESSFFLRDTYHPDRSALTVFGNLWLKHATLTNSSYADARISALDRFSPHDAIRVAYGATTTEPTADELTQPFTTGALADGTLQGAGGGQTYVCGGLNAIGSGAPQLESSLVPERGVDYEAAYAHGWQNGSTFTAQLYNVNVFNKLFPTIVPLSQTGTSFLPASAIANASAALNGVCGAGNYQLGVTQTLNAGTMRASGADLSGRWRFTRRLFADYDWAVTSTVLVNAPPGLLASNLTYIPGAQLPRIPLHTFDGSLDATLGEAIDVRYTLHTVSANNTKALPAYNYSDLVLTYAPLGHGAFTCTVSNLFNQYANIAGLLGMGVPLPLNRYANAASYAPLIGTSATEQYGLPYRQIYFSYQLHL